MNNLLCAVSSQCILKDAISFAFHTRLLALCIVAFEFVARSHTVHMPSAILCCVSNPHFTFFFHFFFGKACRSTAAMARVKQIFKKNLRHRRRIPYALHSTYAEWIFYRKPNKTAHAINKRCACYCLFWFLFLAYHRRIRD